MSGSREIYSHRTVCSILHCDNAQQQQQQQLQVVLQLTDLTVHETCKHPATVFFFLSFLFLYARQFESLRRSEFSYFFIYARAVPLYEVCQHYQLRGSLQSKHTGCRLILKREDATMERRELEGKSHRASVWEVEAWR